MTTPTIVAEVDGGPAVRTFPRTGPAAIDWIAERPDAVVLRLPPGGDTSAPVERWEDVTAAGLRERVRDIGRLGDGYLRIIGRTKELIVTAGGKHVAPVPLEEHLTQHPLIGQAMVVGDNRPFVAALLTIDSEAAAAWARNNDIPEDADLATHPVALDSVQAHVAEVNAQVFAAESIRQWRLLPAEWTVASGDLTPTMKLKRAVVAEGARAAIEEMYENRPR